MKARLLLPCLFALFSVCPTRAQEVSFGFSAGLPMTNLLEARDGEVSETSRYSFGPAVRVGLPHDFAVDVSMMYKRGEFGFSSDPARASVHRLELPVQLRYLFPGSRVRPWIHLGMSFNRVLSVGGAEACGEAGLGEPLFCVAGGAAAVMRHKTTRGPTVGGGLELRKGRMRLDPEVRITRWVDRNFGTRDSSLQSNLTQVEVLLGVSF